MSPDEAFNTILNNAEPFNEKNQKKYYAAFDSLREMGLGPNDPYFDLLELKSDDPRLLENRNALTAYCNYIMQTTRKEFHNISSRYQLISHFLDHLNVENTGGSLIQLPSPAWSVPVVNIMDLIRGNLEQNNKAITLSSGKAIQPADLKFTILDDKNVAYRSPQEIAELCTATNSPFPSALIAYRPVKVALHTAITLVSTRVQLIPEDKGKKPELDHEPDMDRNVEMVIKHAWDDIQKSAAELDKERVEIQSRVAAIYDSPDSHKFDNDRDQAILSEITKIRASVEKVKTLGNYKEGYNNRDAVIALVTDNLYKQIAAQTMSEIVNRHINILIDKQELLALEIPDPDKRVTFIVAGGQASGKSTSVQEYRDIADKEFNGWGNFYKGSTDALREICLKHGGEQRKDMEPELFEPLTTPQASHLNHNIIGGELKTLAQSGKCPNMFLEECLMRNDKIDIGLANGGKVRVTLVSAEATECVKRAYQRGLDTGRYIPAPHILNYHKLTADQLPDRLMQYSGKDLFIKIVDNNVPKGQNPTPIAEIDCASNTIRILDKQKFEKFIKKSAINPNASSFDDVYDENKLKTLTIDTYLQKLNNTYNIQYASETHTPHFNAK